MTNFHFQFQRRQIARLQTDVLLDAFNPETISDCSLGEYFGTVNIEIAGYTSRDPHPLVDPGIRRFLRKLGRRWHPGAAPFFCQFGSQFLWLYFAAQLDHLTICQRPDKDDLIVVHHREELRALRATTLAGLHQLGQRAGISKSAISGHQQILSELIVGLFRHECRES